MTSNLKSPMLLEIGNHESPIVKRMLFDILTRHGNIKIYTQRSCSYTDKIIRKTAVSYKGMQMINLPDVGYMTHSLRWPSGNSLTRTRHLNLSVSGSG